MAELFFAWTVTCGNLRDHCTYSRKCVQPLAAPPKKKYALIHPIPQYTTCFRLPRELPKSRRKLLNATNRCTVLRESHRNRCRLLARHLHRSACRKSFRQEFGTSRPDIHVLVRGQASIGALIIFGFIFSRLFLGNRFGFLINIDAIEIVRCPSN